MVITYMLFLKRKKGMTKEQFRTHYETSHALLAKKFFGHLFLDYRRHYPEDTVQFTVDGQASSVSDDSAFDAISKVDFKDRATYEEFLRVGAQPHVRAELGPDELRFLDMEGVRVSICEEVRTWTSADLAKSA